MDHYKHPRRLGTLQDPSVERHEKNPSCGDEVTLQLTIEDGVITDAAFDGHGCAISIAATSMLLEDLPGTAVDDALRMDREEMLERIGTPLTTMRVKCGLLGLHTLKKALASHLQRDMKGEW